MPGPFELIIILVIVLLIFGGKRLKNIGSDLGGAIQGFKKSMKDEIKPENKIPAAEGFISGVGTNSDALASNHNAKRGNVGVKRPDLDAIEAGDI